MRAGKKWPARALHAPTDFGLWLDTGGHAVLQYTFSSGMAVARSAKSRGGGDDDGGGEGGGGGGGGEGGGPGKMERAGSSGLFGTPHVAHYSERVDLWALHCVV